jgi:hypothetical protein
VDPAPFEFGWPSTRATLQRIATHVLAQARQHHDQLFDLRPCPGGFATHPVGPARERLRLAADSLIIERVTGADVYTAEATTVVVPTLGATINDLCAAAGFSPSPDFWVGSDTPDLGDPEEALVYDPAALAALGDWYLLGQRAIDIATAELARQGDPAASVGRLWPEHFDYGIDLDPTAGSVPDAPRCNLGAAAGDGYHEMPYLYVGPWEVEWEVGSGPGEPEYWNATFGAIVDIVDIARSDDPLGAAVTFFTRGMDYLRSG